MNGDLFPVPTATSLADLDRAADAAVKRAEETHDPFHAIRAQTLVRQADALRRRLAKEAT